MIIQISGQMGSGKTALVKQLKDYLEQNYVQVFYVKYADPLYEMHDEALKVLRKYGLERGKKDRSLLQVIGTEYGRNCLGENVWSDLAKYRAEQFLSTGDLFNQSKVVLIDDCRFPNELKTFPDGFNIRLVCDEEVRKARAESWSDKPHPSESALTGYENDFTLVLDTNELSAKETFQKVIEHERILCLIRSGSGPTAYTGDHKESMESSVQ